jgi:hypothetical protein
MESEGILQEPELIFRLNEEIVYWCLSGHWNRRGKLVVD